MTSLLFPTARRPDTRNRRVFTTTALLFGDFLLCTTLLLISFVDLYCYAQSSPTTTAAPSLPVVVPPGFWCPSEMLLASSSSSSSSSSSATAATNSSDHDGLALLRCSSSSPQAMSSVVSTSVPSSLTFKLVFDVPLPTATTTTMNTTGWQCEISSNSAPPAGTATDVLHIGDTYVALTYVVSGAVVTRLPLFLTSAIRRDVNYNGSSKHINNSSSSGASLLATVVNRSAVLNAWAEWMLTRNVTFNNTSLSLLGVAAAFGVTLRIVPSAYSLQLLRSPSTSTMLQQTLHIEMRFLVTAAATGDESARRRRRPSPPLWSGRGGAGVAAFLRRFGRGGRAKGVFGLEQFVNANILKGVHVGGVVSNVSVFEVTDANASSAATPTSTTLNASIGWSCSSSSSSLLLLSQFVASASTISPLLAPLRVTTGKEGGWGVENVSSRFLNGAATARDVLSRWNMIANVSTTSASTLVVSLPVSLASSSSSSPQFYMPVFVGTHWTNVLINPSLTPSAFATATTSPPPAASIIRHDVSHWVVEMSGNVTVSSAQWMNYSNNSDDVIAAAIHAEITGNDDDGVLNDCNQTTNSQESVNWWCGGRVRILLSEGLGGIRLSSWVSSRPWRCTEVALVKVTNISITSSVVE
ncbi:membrane-associated protein, putative, partial [Bodo saltans]